MLTATTKGLQGEYIAAATLLSLGFSVALAAQDKVDLVIWDDEGNFYRVQVKSSSLKIKAGRNPSYHFNLGGGSKAKRLPRIADYDLIACVALQHRKCTFYATEQVQQFTKRMPAKRFDNEGIEMQTFQKAMQTIQGRVK